MAKTSRELQLLDAAILEAMKARPAGIMTYVIRNILAFEKGYKGIGTPAVLARLKRMERLRKVERTSTNYLVQICWKAVL